MADSSSSLSVSGGSDGIGARLDDMRTEAKSLEKAAAALLEKAHSAAGVATDGDLLESAVLSPVTAAVAEQKVAFATGKLVLYGTESGVTATFLEGAVVAYETVDRALAALADAGANAAMFAVGVAAIPLAVVGGVAAMGDVAATYVAGYGGEAAEALIEGVSKTLRDPRNLESPQNILAALVLNTASSFDSAEAQSATNALLAQQLQQLNVLAGNSGVVDLIAKGAPGLLTGLTIPFVVLLGPSTAWTTLTVLTGVPWPPTSYEQAVQAIIGAGNKQGMLEDGRKLTRDDLFTPPPITSVPTVTPHNVSDLFAGSSQIDNYDVLDGEVDSFARIRITTVPGSPPHYVVQIPSTQNWDLTSGATPNDVTADTQAMLARQTALSSAVDAAMQKAGIKSTDPVMLEGFSLGGITAGQMAADPSLHYNITHVVTGGAPIANFHIPSTTKVLAFEYNQDPVAQLDGHANPSSANFTTVKADAPLLPMDKGIAPGIAGAHNAERYAETAAQAVKLGNSSIDGFDSSASGFFANGGVTTDYGARR